MAEQALRGIRNVDQADSDFMTFFRIVQDSASSTGCVFFLWSPECHDGPVGDVWCEDLSGWLVPFDKADAFEGLWLSRDDSIWSNEFDQFQAFARWAAGDGDQVVISFELPLRETVA